MGAPRRARRATTTGGRQERNRRAGTENVPAIVGLGVAARVAREQLESTAAGCRALRDRLEAGILARVPGAVVNGAPDARVPNTTSVSFDGVEAEALLIALDLEGIAVSTGSACSSGTLEPSHVLRAMGFPPRRVQSSIRFSVGLGNTDAEIDRVSGYCPGSSAGCARSPGPGPGPAETGTAAFLPLRRPLAGAPRLPQVAANLPDGPDVMTIHAPDGGEDGRIVWSGDPPRTPFLPSQRCHPLRALGAAPP